MAGRTSQTHFDVVILGSGTAGSILGAILARAGVSVLVLDAGVHPRFAVGESTIPHTLNVFRMLGARYGVPELEAFCSFDKGIREIGPTLGTKQHFGFMMHREGEEPDHGQSVQMGTELPHLHTSHLFRQDTDAYLFHAAVRYGCVARQAFRVASVDLGDERVEVVGATGERFICRYLVDASGFRSPVAEQLGLRPDPSPLKHHSRSLFTHMLDVRPTDDCIQVPAAQRPPALWVNGTMHHCFERGWFWIIPFNNDPRSLNPLVSVGLTFDERRYPKPVDMTPEEEFYHHVDRFPVLQRIFAGARTVRPWVSTGRLQYTATRTIGHRWCLMSHAAGFIDPLYSRGLANTGEIINAFAWRLLDALAADDFAEERFEYVDTLQQGLIRYNDDLVNCSFIAWSDPALWNAVMRVWAAAQIPTSMHFGQAIERFAVGGDPAPFAELERYPHPGLPLPGNEAYKQLFDEMVRICEAYEAGTMTGADAGAQLQAKVVASPALVPFMGLEDPDQRFFSASLPSFVKMARYLATEGPQDMRYLAANPGFAQMLSASPV